MPKYYGDFNKKKIIFFLYNINKYTNFIQICSLVNEGSHGIEPKGDDTHFLKIGFVVAGGGFYSYYNLHCIELDKENRIQ